MLTKQSAQPVRVDHEQRRADEVVEIPLVVDLDGTLVRSDLLYESFFDNSVLGFRSFLRAVRALCAGKAAAKRYLAAASDLDYATLPFDDRVLELIRQAKAQHRLVYLVTGADERHAQAIVAHVNLFDGYFASDGQTNLSGPRRAEALVAAFGEKGFDYIGSNAADLPVWQKARNAYGIRLSSSLQRRLTALNGEYRALSAEKSSPKVWLKALRVHHYVKNLLVFVPVLTAHQFAPEPILRSTIAFLAFCACASATYILNDILDLKEDRTHPGKRDRPFASGHIPISVGLLMIPTLLLAAFGLAAAVSLEFVVVIVGYFVLAAGYSFYLKRKMLIDTVVLAMLYLMRIIGGAVAINVTVSEWLFAFSICVFTSLALIKRYVELCVRSDHGLAGPANRDYRIGDIDIVAALAAATGMNAVTIFALYVSSPIVQTLYSRPRLLWLICPILLYWIGRALLMAHRRQMHDDPIVFALRDRASAVAIGLILLIVIAAI